MQTLAQLLYRVLQDDSTNIRRKSCIATSKSEVLIESDTIYNEWTARLMIGCNKHDSTYHFEHAYCGLTTCKWGHKWYGVRFAYFSEWPH